MVAVDLPGTPDLGPLRWVQGPVKGTQALFRRAFAQVIRRGEIVHIMHSIGLEQMFD